MDRESTPTRKRSIRLAGLALGLLLVSLLFVYSVRSQGGGLEVGYAILRGENGSRVPVASALFSLRSAGVLVSEAGVGAVEPIRRGRIFVDQRGTQTGIALANPFEEGAEVTWVLRDAAGIPRCEADQPIAERGHLAKNVGELFQGVVCDVPTIGSLTFEVRAGPGLGAVTIRISQNSSDDPIFATLPVVDLDQGTSSAGLTQGADASSVVFPHLGAGEIPSAQQILSTQLILINTSAEPISGEIQLFGDDGLPLELELQVDEEVAPTTAASGPASVFDYEVAAQGTYRATLSSSAGVFAGYAVVTLEQGERPPSGTAIFQYRKADGSLISEAGVGAVLSTRKARIFVDTVQTQTGVALAAASAEAPARVTFELINRYGDSIATVQTGTEAFPDLAPGGHLARFAEQLFPNELPADFRGVMEITSATPLYPVTLKFTSNADSDNQPILTTLPLADLERPIEAELAVLPQMGFGGAGDGRELATRLILISQEDDQASVGKLGFTRSMNQTSGDPGVPWTVPLGGTEADESDYRLPPGGANRLRPGNRATVGAIILPAAVGNEIPVAVDKGVRLRPRVLDSSGEMRDDFPLKFFSLDSEIASVDPFGWIQGKEKGFSTLTVSAGEILQGATLTVTETGSAVSGGFTDVRGVLQDGVRRVYLSSRNQHTVLRAPGVGQAPERFAGTGAAGFKDDVKRLQAEFDQPAFLALRKSSGGAQLYVSDSANDRIRQVVVDPVTDFFEGEVSTLADGFHNPQGIALDNLGHLWVADADSHTIRRIDLRDKGVETIAGEAGTSGCKDGVGVQARFQRPTGIFKVPKSAVQQLIQPSPLTMIVADRGCNSLRLISQEDQEGQVWRVETIGNTDLALSQAGAFGTTPILFDRPEGVAVDPFGNIFVSEPETQRVKTLLTTGELVPAAQDGILVSPQGLAISQLGRLLVADAGTAREIVYGAPEVTAVTVIDAEGRTVDPPKVGAEGGEKVTIKGRNFAPDSAVVIAGVLIPDLDIEDTQTIRFVAPTLPSGLTNLTVQNRGGLVQTSLLIDAIPFNELAAGYITTVAGGTTFAGDGFKAHVATLKRPRGVAVDGAGNLFIVDTLNLRIRKVDAVTGIITTVAGTGEIGFSGDGGPATAADLRFPYGVAVDGAGNLFIADSGNNRIRKVDGAGIITTVAGTGERAFSGDRGPATAADLNFPWGVAVDGAGNLFIADTRNRRIRKVDGATKIITTAAGTGEAGFSGAEGPATAAALDFTTGVAVDAVGNLFITDTDNLSSSFAASTSHLRKVDGATKIITTVAGTGESGFSGDRGPATAAALNLPYGVAVDGADNLFIADLGNHRIRKVDGATKIITTVAGTGEAGFSGDGGPATAAALNLPRGVAVDGVGNLFFSTGVLSNGRIRVVRGIQQP